MNQQIVRIQLDIMPTYHYMQNQEKLTMQSRESDQNLSAEWIGVGSDSLKSFLPSQIYQSLALIY